LGVWHCFKGKKSPTHGIFNATKLQWLSFAGNVYTGTIFPIKYGGKLQDIKIMFNQFLANMQHGLPISAPLRRFCTKPATFP
jgi:hypothetical protein